ncbi:MAG: hypothetical protein NTV26_01305 [Caldiserica bacterium]|nr:hypothetical protein [Caldisericota bacterium]
MAAIETALAVTLLPHFIADTSYVLPYELPSNQPYVTANPPSRELFEETVYLWWQEKGVAADADKLQILYYGSCLTDLKGVWTDVEEDPNACEGAATISLDNVRALSCR